MSSPITSSVSYVSSHPSSTPWIILNHHHSDYTISIHSSDGRTKTYYPETVHGVIPYSMGWEASFGTNLFLADHSEVLRSLMSQWISPVHNLKENETRLFLHLKNTIPPRRTRHYTPPPIISSLLSLITQQTEDALLSDEMKAYIRHLSREVYLVGDGAEIIVTVKKPDRAKPYSMHLSAGHGSSTLIKWNFTPGEKLVGEEVTEEEQASFEKLKNEWQAAAVNGSH